MSIVKKIYNVTIARVGPAIDFVVNLATNVVGILPIINGGTGANTASGARSNLGLGTIATQSAADYVTIATEQTITAKKAFGTGAAMLAQANYITTDDRGAAAYIANIARTANGYFGAAGYFESVGAANGTTVFISRTTPATGSFSQGAGVLDVGSTAAETAVPHMRVRAWNTSSTSTVMLLQNRGTGDFLNLQSTFTTVFRITSTGRVDLNSLVLTQSFTPTSSADTAGITGQLARDDNYLYVKTSTGWKRAMLTSWTVGETMSEDILTY